MNGLIKEVAHALPDTALMGTVSLVCFFLVYTAVLLWTLSRKKEEMKTAASLPLEDDQPSALETAGGSPVGNGSEERSAWLA